jgi:hypothetical protein
LITVDGSGDVDTVTSRLRIQIDQVLADSERPNAPANHLDGSVPKKFSGS